jgi:formylglycine-generating enzyme required for sulfatase activity
LANVWDDSAGAVNRLLPGGSFPATGPGLFDLAGSVWEWCEDRYQPGLKQLPRDGSANREGFGRVVRGGSWRRDIDLATVSTRSWYDEDYAADDVGFRCVMPVRETVSDAQVLAIAVRSFAVEVPIGEELANASISAEDRRYLDRRSVTWLLLEKRVGDAARRSASLLRREPRDTVALDVLDRVPDEMVEAAQAGELEVVAALREALDQAAAVSSRFDRLPREVQPRLVEALLECGETAAEAGDHRRARSCLEAGLEIDPTNTRLRRTLTAAAPRPGEVRVSDDDHGVMVWVPGGSYRIGASADDRQAVPVEFPPRDVVVAGFWIDRDEVTNADYRRCVEAGACSAPGTSESYANPDRADHPVLGVSWFQAREFAAWSGKRLPTEAEWEIAARTGGTGRFPWGDQWQLGLANALGTDSGDRWNADAPVGSFPANRWGVRDMIGNAAEWVEDVFHPDLVGLPSDGGPWLQETGPASERQRVVRGGSYADPVSRQRVSWRDSHRPETGARDVGFRCAAD